jgi:hypothetical protein
VDGLDGPEEGWLRSTRALLRADATVSQNFFTAFHKEFTPVSRLSPLARCIFRTSKAADYTAPEIPRRFLKETDDVPN